MPQFAAPYAEALTHLRKLQSDATVYLAAIDRLKASIATELNRDNPQALVAVLKETAEKYPGLGGLDNLRQDLARYIEIKKEARTRKSGRLFALLVKARFTTPPFQEGFRTMAAGRQLPGDELVRQYAAATQPWKEGNAAESLAALQKIAAGPWAEAIAGEAGAQAGCGGAVRGVAAGARGERLCGATAGVSCIARSRRGRPLRARHAGRSGVATRQARSCVRRSR